MARKTTVLITGCTPGGIGHALALEFHKRGCHVIATARRPEVLVDLGSMGISTLQLDVTDEESVARCRAEAGALLVDGKLDVLVNNACVHSLNHIEKGNIWHEDSRRGEYRGVFRAVPALDHETESAKAMFDVNVFGLMRMCKAFVDLLIPARGLIVNVSSVCAILPAIFLSVYSSCKAAVDQYTAVLRQELEPLHVRIMLIQAGGVDTNIFKDDDSFLPTDSRYTAARDVYDSFICTFRDIVQTTPSDRFAARVVGAALKGEPRLAGLLGGTPDCLWYGGLTFSTWVYQLSFVPTWVRRLMLNAFLRNRRMIRLIREADVGNKLHQS
ncbi:hypothetical protein CDD80_2367 [Ophiocordyceps camponoti-rufipedis]|uniref:NADPH-dependent 1-acyldihydroxyacetone phosphate reductase n=1 Tax=Ophiocordyceps camponoti-rufipedis TaxID=2004952 RepID=A0A2C5Z0U0_9HYPO|nr:hypothetical protein CDD80_2367 [Ophiocordyceps camponoti-rufipedis]